MKIEIIEYNPQWEKDFLKEKEIISSALEKFSPVIEHIGSTSVKGLGAKPIIDIMLGLEKHEYLDLISEQMISIGFTYYRIYNDLMPERRFFVRQKKSDLLPTLKYYDKDEITPKERGYISIVNCHCTTLNNEFWNRHLSFRNYLRNNDNVRDEYYNLKKDLSKKEWEKLNDYADAKTDFIRSIEKKALDLYNYHKVL
ncbi:MAG: GrpB family protein [Candidatus Sericytochromatia bacterium]